jgi:hypothetical protein
MSKKYNSLFFEKTWGFIQKYPINNKQIEHNVWGKLSKPNAVMLEEGRRMNSLLENSHMVAVDFCPVPKYLQMLFIPVFHPDDLKRLGKHKFLKNLHEPDEDPILGYWFPYKFGDPQHHSDMGFVDVPKKNPEYPFVFTGSMCGCHLVITDSPVDKIAKTHFRVWHYQSPESNPIYTPEQWDMGGKGFPGNTVFDWLSFARFEGIHKKHDVYGGDPGKIEEAFGFNFLRYFEGEWFLNSQPLKCPDAKKYDLKLYKKKPFARRLLLDYSGIYKHWANPALLKEKAPKKAQPTFPREGYCTKCNKWIPVTRAATMCFKHKKKFKEIRDRE